MPLLPLSMTYSFLDNVATLSGPGGVISLGSGAANAEEGISIEAIQETDHLEIGADGSGVHSLNASRAAKITVRLLKTSPVNSQLMIMYNLQRSSSLFWAQNVLNVGNPVLGDQYVATGVAFVRNPNNQYAKEATHLDWEFNATQADAVLGTLVNF